MSKAFISLQQVLPQHVLSRTLGKVAECRSVWLKNFLIRRFIGRYGVDMQDALHEAPEHYENFNSFFTRALKPGLRPLPDDPLAVVSPADGAISAIGPIENESIFQAKGKLFSLQALLGGDALWAGKFHDGSFATVYLSPKDYHRVHMPYSGTLIGMVYVPGHLFSVNQVTAENIDSLFARNERAVCLFDTDKGPMAVILVGAMIVAGIETVWAGQVAPANNKVSGAPEQQAGVRLTRGAEMGRFKLGSTAIVLFGPGMQTWDTQLQTGSPLRMGQQMGRMLSP